MAPFPNFLSRRLIEQLSMTVPMAGCWIWLGSMMSHGYGRIKCVGIDYRAHQASYIVFKGQIPIGFLVRHTCNLKCCVNPDHLLLGDNQDNIDDAVKAGVWKNSIRVKAKYEAQRYLTKEQAMEIRTKYGTKARYTQGEPTFQSLANEYGVSVKVIWRIINAIS